MNIAIALVILALTDCVLCGFRGAAGTEGRLDKHAFYKSAIRRAFWLALAVVSAHVALTWALVATAPDPDATWAAFLVGGRTCVLVYAIFATAIFTAFGFYFAPIGDFRVLTNVIVFGPLTILRPYVIALGLLLAVWSAGNTRVAIVGVSAGVAMLLFQRVADRPYASRWRRLVRR